MKEIIPAFVDQVAHSQKVAATVSGSTMGTGLATALEWIPTDIGKLATLVGIVLSVVLIYSHLIQRKQKNAEHKLKIAIMQNELKESEDRIGRRDRHDDLDG